MDSNKKQAGLDTTARISRKYTSDKKDYNHLIFRIEHFLTKIKEAEKDFYMEETDHKEGSLRYKPSGRNADLTRMLIEILAFIDQKGCNVDTCVGAILQYRKDFIDKYKIDDKSVIQHFKI